MKKERTLAIVGIVLALVAISLLLLERKIVDDEYFNRGYDYGNNDNRDAFQEISGEVRANTVMDEISFAVGLCGLILYPVFHYIVSLRAGIRIKDKITIILTIIGSVLVVFILGIFILDLYDPYTGLRWNYSSWRLFFPSFFYYLAFSIIMLVRSFKKPEIEA